MVTKKRFENRAELLKSNSIRWWPNYQSNSQGIRLLFKLCECTWKKKSSNFLFLLMKLKSDIFWHHWCSQLVFWQSFLSQHVFFFKVLHPFWLVLLGGVEVYEFEEFPGDSKEHRTPQPLSFGFPAHFGSNCLCNYVAKLSSTIEVEKKKTLPTAAPAMSDSVSPLFWAFFSTPQLGNFTFFTTLWMIFRMWPQSSPRAKAWAVRLGKSII